MPAAPLTWLHEAGIGEHRAALVDGEGQIVEAQVERIDTGPRLGLVARARLLERPARGQARIRLDGGEEALLVRAPAGLTEGASLAVEIVREAIPEPGRVKPPRAAPTDAAPRPAQSLRDRLAGAPVREVLAHGPDLLEQAGWSELMEEARTGDIAFAGGALRLHVTPAMTLIDVDGHLPARPLALAGARAAAAAVRRLGVGGSIGIDLPTLAGRAERQAVAAALDEALPPPFERTAMNGFGFLQVVRPRPRASLPELVRADPVLADALAALRRLEREPPGAPITHRLPPAVHARLIARPDWLAELARRTGVVHRLEPA